MRRLRNLTGPSILLCLGIAYLLLMQGRIGYHTFDLVFAVTISATIWSALDRAGVAGGRAGIVAVLYLAILAAVAVSFPAVRLAPYVAIVPVNLAVAAVFARGLFPGRVPVILQLIKLMKLAPVDDVRFVGFVRGQCFLWTGLSFATGAAGAIAMISPSTRPVLDAVIAMLFAAQIAWFVLSHYYAGWRYGRPETWSGTLRAMARSETLAALRV